MTSNPHTPQAGSGLLAMVNESLQLEQRILEAAERTGGERDPFLESYLEAIQTSIATSVDRYKYVLDKIGMAAEMMEARADEFAGAANALFTAQDRMKDRIKTAMLMLETDEVAGSLWRFKLSKTKGRLMVEEDKLPAEYLIVKQVSSPDNERIRADLEAGKEIPGASISPGFQLRNYVQKGSA